MISTLNSSKINTTTPTTTSTTTPTTTSTTTPTTTSTTTLTTTSTTTSTKILKKRGRKSKQELLDIINASNNIAHVVPITCKTTTVNDPIRAKRGRKPNSAKIVENVNAINIQNAFQINKTTNLPSVILHLMCRVLDTLESNDYKFCNISNFSQNLGSELNDNDVEQFANQSSQKVIYDYSKILNQVDLSQPITSESHLNLDNSQIIIPTVSSSKNMLKEINKKIKHLDFILSSGIEIKQSACFWCTECFINKPIYIPKHKCDDIFHVYGNFCTLECAAAYLLKFSIHQSVTMEQYALLHSLYLDCSPSHIKGIKPAPEPRYMLDKFLGNLSIEEYRSLNNTNRFFILLDKPITKITPEYHEEYSNFRVQEKNIPSASS